MHKFYSHRSGSNPNINGLPLKDFIGLFERVFDQLRQDGYFDEAFGFYCVDNDYISGTVKDIELEILLSVRKKNLWPIHQYSSNFLEDDLFDLIEFLYLHISKPIKGTMHSYADCGMHWETFNKKDGQKDFKDKINQVLVHYEKQFLLSDTGEILHKPENGFEVIFNANIPSTDVNVVSRITAATIRFQRHGASIDDRRQAVRDLSDVLEYLRPQIEKLLTSKDESDLFNIANNFGIRHHNDRQKTSYDAAIWLSWMFYFYLSTIHVILRKAGQENLFA